MYYVYEEFAFRQAYVTFAAKQAVKYFIWAFAAFTECPALRSCRAVQRGP